MHLSGPHRPRPIRFLGLEAPGEWRTKLYGIAANGDQPRRELIDAALSALPAHLPERDERIPGVALMIVHDAADFCFVLVDWFAGENEIHQCLLSAPLERPDQLTAYAGQAIGCVWELAVIDFERRAWLEHVLANPGGPSLDAYLNAHFEGEL
jgi:hypothetical protein